MSTRKYFSFGVMYNTKVYQYNQNQLPILCANVHVCKVCTVPEKNPSSSHTRGRETHYDTEAEHFLIYK